MTIRRSEIKLLNPFFVGPVRTPAHRMFVDSLSAAFSCRPSIYKPRSSNLNPFVFLTAARSLDASFCISMSLSNPFSSSYSSRFARSYPSSSNVLYNCCLVSSSLEDPIFVFSQPSIIFGSFGTPPMSFSRNETVTL